VENQSISEAARKNFITQSAVSQGILKLEKSLNLNLISHHRNLFKLTDEGEKLYCLTQQLFGILKTMQNLSQEREEEISGQINITCTQSIAVNLLSKVLQQMQKLYPKVVINLKISKIEQICLMLKKGAMDVGIVIESDICEGFQKEEILKGNFHLYSKTGVMSRGVYVDHTTGLFVSKLAAMYRRRFRKEMLIAQELDSWQLLAKCASQGIGTAFLPDFIAANESTLKVCTNIKPIPYCIIAFFAKGTHLTRAGRVFIDLLQKKRSNVIVS
jgi:DNA-binding transcriptional LysR family regulator